MEMEIISRETIKPSSPTPLHLRTYPLSFFDNMVAPTAIPLLYFYPNPNNDEYGQGNSITKISILKNSLSKVLSIYYPLAGRIKDKISIDCNDQGVSLLVTRIQSKLSETLLQKEALLNSLFPDGLHWEVMSSSASLLAIQINAFACDGIAISVCLSHKVGDLSNLANFVNDWASLTRVNYNKDGEESPPLPFSLPVIYADERDSPFPQGNLAVLTELQSVKQKGVVCKRLVFEGSKIESLKAIARSHEVETPTRVEVVTALICKCAISAWGLSSASLRVVINFRKRMEPPLPDKSLGNMGWNFYVSNEQRVDQEEEEEETELKYLVRNIRTELCEFCDKYVKNFGDSSLAYEFLKQAFLELFNKRSLFYVSSWCRFGTYKADFGWGKPIWVTSSECPVRNVICLMDTRDGRGIEAIVNMEEKDMALFLRDELLLQFASLDPNRLI